MRFLNPGVPVRMAGAALFAAMVCMPLLADTPPDGGSATVPAVWTPKELHFIYQGFTAQYSCDGLRDKIRAVLLRLGARQDLQVRASPCSEALGRPSTFPGVTVKMNVLEPATDKSGTAATPVQAHWKTVDLPSAADLFREAGDCELIEQIKQSILPQFATRNVEYSSTCIPHQLEIGGTRLSADVLITDQTGAGPPGPAR